MGKKGVYLVFPTQIRLGVYVLIIVFKAFINIFQSCFNSICMCISYFVNSCSLLVVFVV